MANDPKYNPDGTRNYRYADDGTDLLASINLNLNPNDIRSVNGKSIPSVWEKQTYFWGFINSLIRNGTINPGDTSINSDKKLKEFTLNLINKFNTDSEWSAFSTSHPERGSNNPMTIEDIKAIQAFNAITDPKVKIDGQIGTQTLALHYPLVREFTQEITNPNSENYFPVIWGNKRYVVSTKDWKEWFNKPYSKGSYIKVITPYNPSQHDGKFIYDPNGIREWKRIGTETIPNPPAGQVNIETAKRASERRTAQIQTVLNRTITK